MSKAPARPAAEISLTTRGGPFPDVSAATLRRRAGKMLEHLRLSGVEGIERVERVERVELSIALVSDAVIRELNRDYRRKDKPTDVLAFPMNDPPAGGGPLTAPVSGLLGDVILSVETARRQAEANSRPLLAELTMLLAHGLLHLLGYDHQTDAEEREMTALTRELELAADAGAGALAKRGEAAKKAVKSKETKRAKKPASKPANKKVGKKTQ
jgi:probable rRNA maturation factor